MNKNRPVNLDLLAFQFPLAAKASVVHRAAGIILFVAVAFMLYALDMSLASEQSFADLKGAFDNGVVKFITWGMLTALGYHFVAGIRHLLMDFGVADTKEGGKTTALLTIVLSAILSVLAGVWVW
ncbi:MAG: succinate dehydrogenase, cytochrome b556 subunit [Venatoribacter sp.]